MARSVPKFVRNILVKTSYGNRGAGTDRPRQAACILRNHILPALGRVPAAAVEQRHVIELQQTLGTRLNTANKVVKILSHMYRLPLRTAGV